MVLIPSELTKTQKEEIAKKKTTVYTNSDLLLKITNGIDEFCDSPTLGTFILSII